MLRVIKTCFFVILGLLFTALLYYLWFFNRVLFPQERSFEEVRQLLLPHMQVFRPDSNEQRPAVLLFHGCGGLQPYMIPRAEHLAANGYVAILLDSYTERGVIWEDTCAGRELPGFQRAADVLAGIDIARSLPGVDSSQLFLMGYSHGGWTILEALNFDDELPSALRDSPGAHLDGVKGLIAWYPYCGFAARYAGDGWRRDIPVLMLLAENDATTPPEPCEDIAATTAARGLPVAATVYPGVDHGFDLKNEDWVEVYVPELHARALAEQDAFIARHSGASTD